MKKVLLTGTALLAFAAASLAQSNQTFTNQNGNYQTASQNQNGAYLKSTVNQDKQSGGNQGSYALTNQNATGSAGNEADIQQNLNSYSNRAGLTQSGGANNKGTIEQINSSGGNGSQVLGGTSAADVKANGGNWAGILQEGSGNTNTTIYQNNSSSKNFGEIYQYSNNSRQTSIIQSNNSGENNAAINQGTSGSPSDANKAIISQQSDSYANKAMVEQKGYYGTAMVEQNAHATENEATVKQVGGSNSETATIHQGNYADRNKAMATQSGAGDQATVNQQNSSYDNEATVEQRSAGNFNVATINQTDYAYTNKAVVTQNGQSNQALISQTYAQRNEATISQSLVRPEGGGNKAEIQQGSSAMGASDNKATITQDFSTNTARLQQYGSRNESMMTQLIGDFNVIKGMNGDFALQRGDYNKLTVTQNSGDGTSPYVPNTASVSQVGNFNTATVSQMGHN